MTIRGRPSERHLLDTSVLIARDETVANERARRLAALRAVFAPPPVDESVADRYGAVLATARTQRRAAKAGSRR
jgi:hypothetical protein